MDDDLRESMIDHVRTEVGRGSATFLEVVESTVEYLEDEVDSDDLRALAWSVASEEFAAALAAQATWPERTDNDRLTEAFRALDAAGIVARQDFACCQNCGLAEIGGTVPDPTAARGYVFYHQQDAEHAVEGGGVFLAYGLFGQAPTAEIGAEVAAALTAAGLTVNWDGATEKRIHVSLDWAVRRHGPRAAFPSGPAPELDVEVEVVSGAKWFAIEGEQSAEVLALLDLPWLPTDVRLRVTGEGEPVVVHREFDRLLTGDGRVAGRFDGLRLLRGEASGEYTPEPNLLEVRYDDGSYHHDRPMTLAETLDVVRAVPTAGTWLCALGRSGGVVQMSWSDGRLWVESPNAAEQTTTGAHASIADAERMLRVLATEDRVAVHELDGVGTAPW
ncbi:DUF6891 domain-containing protein [Cryptosporangium minutisporangium]|uniref:DUF6891 domain-containing protein n=1 Tax=Cryptosporangium minutisporangium TaxID=113569 RepID=A0ABP6T0J0_9ACTN